MYSLFLSFIWYTFDDTLAELVGFPPLGELTWWFVFPVIFFMKGILNPFYNFNEKLILPPKN